ncbi:polynucleotide adenylyltransferase/metal dependent phosphohydrolase [Thioalkalivibrio sp. K90mix]|uniref:multifunctional CCA addition/repair protein n=1 Tax=Thioalkalivibrio sp. (strain K90mix) TaxID=396595 RepID=UPI000195A301|nr:multifunctional CCA addition/repair protein [Thioalkalivibrio sp. K90mix]ADC72945.1 polynucleotide adenylyltransferase/metal dependent phosphohydrolase [Thioalkalivibrio sp. K90mix]
MQTYLVGGAVRDRLLGRPVHERDYVVVGATPEAMEAAGYRPVGRDFPVFLHPTTHEEYALARTERKTARGYHGFQFNAAPDVTLEDDLERRDLTINAMAEDADGHLFDPYNGQADLEARLLRHVSPAFSEDPVRLLRVARFAAQLEPWGFRVADDTRELMRELVTSGEVDALVPERVWAECEKALKSPAPRRFIEVLRDAGALARLFPEIECLFGVPQPARYHPEIDTGVHTLMVLDQATRLSESPEVRFAALVHDLGKGNTDPDILPSHHGHEERGVLLIRALAERLRIPNRYRDLAVRVSRYHGLVHRVFELRPKTVMKLVDGLDALRRPENVEPFLLAVEADFRGRTGWEDKPYPQADAVRRAVAAAQGVQPQALMAEGYKGKALGEALDRERIRAIAEALDEHPAP